MSTDFCDDSPSLNFNYVRLYFWKMTPRPSCITANPTRRLSKHPRHTEINPVPPHGTARHSSALRLPGKEKKQQMLLLSKPATELKEATGSQGNFLRDTSCTCGKFPSRKPSLALSCFVWTTQSETRGKGDENKMGIIQITKNKSPPPQVRYKWQNFKSGYRRGYRRRLKDSGAGLFCRSS